MLRGNKSQPTERINKNQLCPKVLRSHMLFTANNRWLCFGMEVGNMILSLTTRAHRLGPFPLDSCFTTQQLSFQSFHQVRFQLQHVTLNIGLIKHCYSENKGKDQDGVRVGWDESFLSRAPKFRHRPPQMRKMMPSDTMTWLSSCILVSAAWISSGEKGSSLSWLMDSVRRFMPTDWA